MSKRAVSFADSVETRTFNHDNLTDSGLLNEYDPPQKSELDDDDGNDSDIERNEDGIPIKKKSKHTLDSDEEDNDDLKELDMKKVEGQEECEVDFDGNTKITAFNMKEDMEDGHFDCDGNFIFDKKEKAIKDAWLDEIDWASIKKKAGDQWEKNDEETEEAPAAVLNDVRRKELFEKLLELLKPEQTVSQALSAITKKKTLTPAEERKLRWAAKKAGKAIEDTDEQKLSKELSSLADELLSAGHMEVYEWPRERIETMLQKMNHAAVDDLDMFSDVPASSSSAPAAVGDIDDEVKWEYKEDPEADIQGPFTSSEMLAKQEKSELSATGVARKVGSGSFNPVSRIDFDLYC